MTKTDRPGADAERLSLALDTARLGDWSWDADPGHAKATGQGHSKHDDSKFSC